MSPEMFRKLAALNLSHEQMAGVLEIVEAEAESRREKARARVQKWRDKQKHETPCNVTEHNETLRDDLRASVTRVEDNLLPKKISRKQENKKAAALSDLDEFKADLATDCSPEQIDAFAKHRKAKNGQNSAYAAKLFRRDAASCGLSPSEAIDVAISRGWLTVKPEYLKGKPNSTAPPKPRNVGELSRDQLLTPRTEIDVTDYTSGRLAARDGGRLSPGSGDAGPFAINGDILGRI